MVLLINRPCLTVQCDWNETLKVNGSNVWVTCKGFGQTGVHGELSSVGTSQDGLPYVVGSNNFGVEKVTRNSMVVTHKDPNCTCTFLALLVRFTAIHKKSILCLDVTDGGLGVSVCTENKLRVWDAKSGELRRELQGHIWDVYTCRFFPSGVVVLSGGADMQLKIWSATTGVCPVTLKGHTAPILDTAIVEKGRNIVSVAKDGSARLWDCGGGSCLGIISEADAVINCCSLQTVDIGLGEPDENPSEREVATEGKLLILGCESGLVRGVGLRSRKVVFEMIGNAAVNCCCFLSSIQVLLGMQDGRIHIIDITAPKEMSVTWEISTSPVLSLLKYGKGFFAGRADGTCTFLTLENDCFLQLTGPDFDPIYKIAAASDFVYTGCRDGQIRKYKIPLEVSH